MGLNRTDRMLFRHMERQKLFGIEVSTRYIAEGTGLGPVDVRQSIDKLVEHGWLREVEATGSESRFIKTLD